ncbi:MAG: NUDIX domain-containing protein, partial [Desulfovibrionaceae bacterium]|nr:NUDIX domain-containing protein [Desulfovibrionaceae bacterium]
TQRVPPSRQAGFWEFPGGKCQPNEDPKEALRRELEEELGLKAQNIVPWLSLEHEYVSEGFKVRLHFFHVKSYLGDPQALEGQVLRWLTPKEALKLPFLAADQTILTRLNSLRIL